MPKTISVHNGTAWSRGHNIRDKRYTKNMTNIDDALTPNNVVIVDTPVRQAYADIFGDAVADYNAGQTRADRKIADYYDKIRDDKRKHPVYECIVQIGDRDDTGVDAEAEKHALIRYAQDWGRRNPNLRLIGAYVHADEPNGTVHMHLDYIPVATCTRGMRLQNSLDRALQQQGYTSSGRHQTAQIEWEHAEREALASICRDMGIDAQPDQGIGNGRTYLTPQEYARAKDRAVERQRDAIDAEVAPLREELEDYKAMRVTADAVPVERKKIPLQKHRVSVTTESLDALEEQAKAYQINRPRFDALDARETAVNAQEKAVKSHADELRTLRDDNWLLRHQLMDAERARSDAERDSASYKSLLDGFSGAAMDRDAIADILIRAMRTVCALAFRPEDGVYMTQEQMAIIGGVATYASDKAQEQHLDDVADALTWDRLRNATIDNDIRAIGAEILYRAQASDTEDKTATASTPTSPAPEPERPPEPPAREIADDEDEEEYTPHRTR